MKKLLLFLLLLPCFAKAQTPRNVYYWFGMNPTGQPVIDDVYWTTLFAPITGTPTIAAGAGAGTSPTLTIATNGYGLKVTLVAGTLPTGLNAVIGTITLPTALTYTPYPVFSVGNSAAALLSGSGSIYMTASSGSTIVITSGSTGLVAGTTYIWNIKL